MNDPWLVFLMVFATVVGSVCTGLLVPLRQRFSKIDPQYFKRVKVKFPSFLFVGIGNRRETGNVRSYGVILPMFLLHILGYLLTIGMWIAVPFLYQYAGVDLDVLWVVPVAAALFQTVTEVVTEVVCVKICRKRAQRDATPTEN